MTHGKRYQFLVDSQEGRKIDNSYRAAFFILSAIPELFEITKKYVSYGIDFLPMKAKLKHDDYYYHRLMAVAKNLYDWREDCNMNPHLIAILPARYVELVINGMKIAGGHCEVKVEENNLILDNQKYEQNLENYTF